MNVLKRDKIRDTAELMQKVRQQGERFVEPTFEDMSDESFADGCLIRRNQPNRRLLLQRYHQPGCPFCRDVATEFLIELPYQTMVISQNLGPYDRLSLLLRSKEHITQAQSIDVLENIGTSLMEEIPDHITLFCNQRAGNSQEHFHFQYIGCLLPVIRLEGLLAPRWQRTGIGEALYCLFDGADSAHNPQRLPVQHFLGCRISGSANDAVQSATAYLRHAANQGYNRFNFTAWRNPETGNSEFYLVLRNPNTLRVPHPDYPMIIGALSVSGFLTDGRPEEALRQIDFEDFCNYLRNKIHTPLAFP